MKKISFPAIIALIVVIIGLFLIITSNLQQPISKEKSAEIEELEKEIVEEEQVSEVIEEVQEGIKTEEIPNEEKTEVIEPPIVKTFITNEKCENGIISLTLNNLFNDSINVKWSTFFISGKINSNPGCDKGYLQPGESTFCSNVGGFPRTGKRRVAIALYKHNTVGVTVDCSSNLVTGSAVKELSYYGLSPVFSIAMLFLLLFIFNYYRVYY